MWCHREMCCHAATTLLCLIVGGGWGGEGGGQIALFEIFHPKKHFKHFIMTHPKYRIFEKVLLPLLITTLSFYETSGKTVKCKMEIMGENQMRKL